LSSEGGAHRSLRHYACANSTRIATSRLS